MLIDLTPLQKEEIGKLWCSKENNNMNLNSDEVWFWDDVGKMYRFQFDITSHPQRKEIEELQKKVKEYENQHGKIENYQDNPYFKELIRDT